MAPASLVCSLADVGAGDRLVAGGKGASLGELHRAGLPVPPGFVVTVAAFEAAMRGADPAGATGAELRARIMVAPLPEHVAAAITAAYRAFGSDAAVAVRSSATGEDSAEASFAGLQDTYLWIRGASSVLDHVRRCWASLYNDEAVSYRLQHGLPESGIAMAVVVQRMVEPRSAGVMFTCSPTTGDRSVIAIEGTWGLGSVLVGGEVTPDSFTVSKVTGEIVRRHVAAKLRLHRADPAGQGTTADDVAAALREQPCLDDEEIRALARLGVAVERHYGTPQDIEWAVTAEEIVLLQSRAETVWTSRAAAPLARPKARAVDHVFEQLSRPVVVRRDQ